MMSVGHQLRFSQVCKSTYYVLLNIRNVLFTRVQLSNVTGSINFLEVYITSLREEWPAIVKFGRAMIF